MERKVLQKLIFSACILIDLDPNTHDAFHLIEQDELVSSVTVFPASTEEVVTVVKWANEYEIPIYPISMGRNCKHPNSC